MPDALRRAFVDAGVAVRALQGVDLGDIVLERDRLRGAGFRAQAAADTADGADPFDIGAAPLGVAEDLHVRRPWDQFETLFGAGHDAGAAADAPVDIDCGESVFDGERAKDTDLDAGAEADTAEGAGVRRSAGKDGCRTAVLNALVDGVARRLVR